MAPCNQEKIKRHCNIISLILPWKKFTSEHQFEGASASEQEFSLSSQEHQKILNHLFLSTPLLAQYPANSFSLLEGCLVKRDLRIKITISVALNFKKYSYLKKSISSFFFNYCRHTVINAFVMFLCSLIGRSESEIMSDITSDQRHKFNNKS